MISNEERIEIADTIYELSYDMDKISNYNRYKRNVDIYLQVEGVVGSRIHLFVNKQGKIECLYTKDGLRIAQKIANNIADAVEFIDECPDLKVKVLSKRKQRDENEVPDEEIEVEKVKRPRGRPKKVLTQEQIDAEKNKPKRPVGRPRKHPKEEVDENIKELKEFLSNRKNNTKVTDNFSFFKYLAFCVKLIK